jgi:hypothetical protein
MAMRIGVAALPRGEGASLQVQAGGYGWSAHSPGSSICVRYIGPAIFAANSVLQRDSSGTAGPAPYAMMFRPPST